MIERKSLFEGGNFVIDFLTSSLDGFAVQTRRPLLRHTPNTPLAGAKKIRQVRDVERKKIRIGPGFAPKVGLRNPEQSGSILSFDIQPVTYPTYRAINNKTDPEEELSISNPSVTAEVLLTTESEVAALTLNEEYMDAIWLTPEAVIECPKIYHPALIQMARDLQAILNP